MHRTKGVQVMVRKPKNSSRKPMNLAAILKIQSGLVSIFFYVSAKSVHLSSYTVQVSWPQLVAKYPNDVLFFFVAFSQFPIGIKLPQPLTKGGKVVKKQITNLRQMRLEVPLTIGGLEIKPELK